MTDTKTCLTCEHWKGRTLEAYSRVEGAGLKALARKGGFVDAATCRQIVWDGIDVTIHGDYTDYDFHTESWFGCNQYEAMKGEQK